MDGANQDYVLAGGKPDPNVPVVEGVNVPSNNPEAFSGAKRGHKCCGGCCDVRRATIIVNIISLVMGTLGVIALAALTGMANNANAANYDDDEVAAAVEELEGYSTNIGVAIGITIARMALNLLGIYGAVTYKVTPVMASLAGYALEFIMALIGFDIGTLVMAGFFAYPHVYLIMEMRTGIMSRETYEQEKFSCCCV